jgi:hypothetical protein
MTNVDSWFLVGAAFVSAVVICGVCFLELTYQLKRRRSRHHAAATSFSGLQTARTARDLASQSRKPADSFQEQLRGSYGEPEVKIDHASTQMAPLGAR